MEIIISNSDKTPIYEQIILQVKRQIVEGKLKSGDPLTSMRNLAKDLRISLITTKRAYNELEAMGFINTIQGKGTFVSGVSDSFLREETLTKIEEHLRAALDLSKAIDLSLDDVIEILEVYYRGE